MARPVGFTPVQRKMLAILADGKPHPRMELHACLVDDLGPLSNIRWHVSKLRKKLEPLGETIACVLTGPRGICYQRVRLLKDAPAAE